MNKVALEGQVNPKVSIACWSIHHDQNAYLDAFANVFDLINLLTGIFYYLG